MPYSRIVGKIDCLSRQYNSLNTDSLYVVNETYVGLFKFLEFLETKGLAQLITYYSGSGGSGTGKDYWDTSNAVGSNAFSVWKFNQYRDRNWDWYLYIHYMTGQTYQAFSNSIPTRVDNGTNDISSTTAAIVMQAAFSISESSSINPWNGTISLSGAAYKANPVWNTGSSGYSVHVFPRVNNASGSFNESKDLCMVARSVVYGSGTQNSFSRYHFLSDGHGILILQEYRGNAEASIRRINAVSYLGPFRLNKNITDYNQGYLLGGTSSYGFVAFTSIPNNTISTNNGFNNWIVNTVPDSTAIGSPTASISNYQGGVFASSKLGVRVAMLSCDSNIVSPTYMPNAFLPQNSIDDRMYAVYSNEISYSGFLGWIESPLLRCISGDYFSYDSTLDNKKIVFGSNLSNTTNRRITVPWSGSIPGTNTTRAGRTIDISRSYW